ncbi:hypothetical protein AUJ63_04580 [Candidatus Pacearchaeota archaeon CG1_02_35_32]|nr:MAG: hypothetical protein AUJ63_04580 [Candidatus Pacearchaeota archaeon CG1_02_35_32]
MEILDLSYKKTGNIMEADLGEIEAGITKEFDLPFIDCKINQIFLSANASGMFSLGIFSKAAKQVRDIIWIGDSSESNMINLFQKIIYQDMDCRRQLHIKINNKAAAMNFNLVVKYE